MYLASLQIRSFRNINDILIEPDRHLNVIIGDNGQGKTSVIEAIHFLCRQKSFRTHQNHDLIQKEQKNFLLRGHVNMSLQNLDEIKVSYGDDGNKIEINRKSISKKQLSTKTRAVVFSPESLAIVKGTPEGRRSLVDNALIQIYEEAYGTYRDYEKLVKFRNTWLRQAKSHEINVEEAESLLETVEGPYLNTAADIIFLRQKMMREITPVFNDIFHKITGQNLKLRMVVEDEGEMLLAMDWKEIREWGQKRLAKVKSKKIEFQLGRTVSGPHLHDISFFVDENDVKNFCSQGQQRAVILAFKMAELVYHKTVFGTYPLLLLDDVLSELDSLKREYLINFLNNNDAQTFLTATELTNEIESNLFKMNSGRITKV